MSSSSVELSNVVTPSVLIMLELNTEHALNDERSSDLTFSTSGVCSNGSGLATENHILAILNS